MYFTKIVSDFFLFFSVCISPQTHTQKDYFKNYFLKSPASCLYATFLKNISTFPNNQYILRYYFSIVKKGFIK